MARKDIRGEEWDLKLIPDLTGKVALVTGANSSTGIGYNVAEQLAIKGAKVYIGARSTEKAEAAIAELKKSNPSGNFLPFVADVSDLKQVKQAAEGLVANETRLDILVNNAGLVPRALDKDKNGISLSFVTNHLGVFVLTTTLLPLLKKTAATSPGVRVVTLSSESHAAVPAGAKFDSVDAFNNDYGAPDGMPSNFVRYGYSKLANILFAKQLQKKFDAEGVQAISVSLHPGGVKTSGAIQFVGDKLHLLDGTLTPLQGAVTPLFAAAAPEVWTEKEKFAGQYLMPFGVPSSADASADSKNPALAEELWVTSEKVVGELLA